MDTDKAPEIGWTAAEETLLALAREQEWAEAYTADYPKCSMGRMYLDFLRWEIVAAQSEI